MLGVVLAATATTPAAAQITYDSDSAAGKQYEIPIDSARTIGAAKPKPGDDRPKGLFGEGLSPRQSAAKAAAGGEGISSDGPKQGSGLAGLGDEERALAAAAAREAAQASGAASRDALGSSGGGFDPAMPAAIVVLLIGAIGGLLATRRARGTLRTSPRAA